MIKSIKPVIIFAMLLLCCSNVKAQQIILNISGYEGTAELFSLEGERTFFVVSLNATDGKIILSAGNYNFHTGFYRIVFNKNIWLDFIYSGKDVEIKTDINNAADSLVVVKSEANKLYLQFIRMNKNYKIKTELLQLILMRYPKDDEYYNQTRKKLSLLQNNYKDFINITSQKNPASFAAKYIHSAQLPIIDQAIPAQQQTDYLKAHALDYVDFNKSRLINSDLFTNKSIEYLTYYRSPQLSKEQLEVEFMKAVDTLLNKAKVQQAVYLHITEYLIAGFRKFGFDKTINYIVENYVIKDDLCLDLKTESSIQRRIDQSTILTVGAAAPDIKIPDINGNIINLNKINAEKILLIFYSSLCPHCQTLLPQVKELYDIQPGNKIEVIAISLDENKKDWLTFVNDNSLNWINAFDGKGWSGQASIDYYIYATPTMFLLDKNKKIIAKPVNINELISEY